MKYFQHGTMSVLLAPDASSTAARTANLDTQGADYAMIALNVSIEANTNSTNVVCDLLESNDETATNFGTFHTNNAVTVDNTAAAVQRWAVDLAGRKRYLRLIVTPDTTTNGAVLVSGCAMLDPEIRPSAASNTAVS